MIVKEIRPIEYLKDYYEKAVQNKASIEEDLKIEYEKVLAERTSKLDEIIRLTSEEVEVEVPDEIDVNEQVEQETNTEDVQY